MASVDLTGTIDYIFKNNTLKRLPKSSLEQQWLDSRVNLDKKHIAFVIDSMHGGGAENVCLTLARELLVKQYRVDLVLLNFHGERLLDIPHDVNLFVLDRRPETRQSMEKCSIPYKNIQWIKRPSGFKELCQFDNSVSNFSPVFIYFFCTS